VPTAQLLGAFLDQQGKKLTEAVQLEMSLHKVRDFISKKKKLTEAVQLAMSLHKVRYFIS